MIRSRVTLAITLAAAIERLKASPPTKAVCGMGNGRTGKPSIKTCSGAMASAATARRIAWWVALKILMRSTSSLPEMETAQPMPFPGRVNSK